MIRREFLQTAVAAVSAASLIGDADYSPRDETAADGSEDRCYHDWQRGEFNVVVPSVDVVEKDGHTHSVEFRPCEPATVTVEVPQHTHSDGPPIECTKCGERRRGYDD